MTANAGYTIDTVTVNGASVGLITTYTFTNVTGNKTIAVTFKTVPAGGCLLARFGVPRATALPDVNSLSFSKVYTVGTATPNLSNVTNAVLNWSLSNNGLWQLSFNTNNGIPTWWLDMRNSVQNFAQAQPAITFNGTGIPNLDSNKYYINVVDANNIVFVEVTGKHAIYFSNSATATAGCATARFGAELASEHDIKTYPNPTNDLLNVSISGELKSNEILLYDLLGKVVFQKTLASAATEATIDMSKLPAGLYKLIVISDTGFLSKNVMKQ
jgi:endoglucanase